MADLRVKVMPWRIMVSRIQRGADPTAQATWGNWQVETRLRVLDVMKLTSAIGHSFAKVQLVTGKPNDIQIDPENGNQVLWLGDRIALGLGDKWIFCGYCVIAQLLIGEKENLTYRIAGPEYLWGTNQPNAGASMMIYGQFRRNHDADDRFVSNFAASMSYSDWDWYTDEQAVFNPDGMRNMTAYDVTLSPSGRPTVQGRIWEVPNRRIGGLDVAEAWNMRQAAKMVVEQWGDFPTTQIQAPDWSTVPMSILDQMKETNIQGVGCWEALHRICSPKYGFYIESAPAKADGTPVAINGNSWGPFQLRFYSRDTGQPADLTLNKRGTPMIKAVASVQRFDAVRDISGTVNRAIVRGSYVRFVRLVYWGGGTNGLAVGNKKIALQHGWHDAEAKIDDYANPKKEVDAGFYGVPDAKRTQWLDRFCSHGKNYDQYWHVFRRFSWNESGAFDTTKQARYFDAVSNWFSPDLTGIADSPDKPNKWMRRRRKPMDTIYLKDPIRNLWERHRPQLFISSAPTASNVAFNTWKWKRVTESHYHLDPNECSVTFTVDDLANWRPFDKQDSPDDAPGNWPQDSRTFGTLLRQGVLRLCLECTIPVDSAMQATAERTDSSGSPFAREVFIDGNPNFYKSLVYADGFTSPSGLTPFNVDLSAEAQNIADQKQYAGRDEAIHASIITSGDAPEVALGSVINQINGRVINLSSTAGRGAQIVGMRLDPTNLKYELLTETIALALRDRDLTLFKRGRVFNARKATSIPNE